MTVAQIKAIEPLAEVYEIRKDARYIIKLNRPARPNQEMISAFREALDKEGLTNCLLMAGMNIEFFEIKE